MAITSCTSLPGSKVENLCGKSIFPHPQGDWPSKHDQGIFGICETRRGLPSRWSSLPQPRLFDTCSEARGGTNRKGSVSSSLHLQVIDKNPEEFKIRCLMDIRRCFEGRNVFAEQPVAERKNPFFAGYGNRPNVSDTENKGIKVLSNQLFMQDALAYRAVGIPVSRIFTINPSGQLKQELTPNFQTS